MKASILSGLHGLFAAALRIALIFLLLLMGVDAISRIYYSYMPISTWVDFRSVKVDVEEGKPVVKLTRVTHGSNIAVFHRALFIAYPHNTRACTASVVAVMDSQRDEEIIVPLARILSQSCPDFIGDQVVDGVLQVSYIFEFPFGVKRTATRYSNRFSLSYAGGSYRLGPPLLAK